MENSSTLGHGLCDKPKTTYKFLLSLLSFYISLVEVRSLALYPSMLTVPSWSANPTPHILSSSAGTEPCLPLPRNLLQQNAYDSLVMIPLPGWVTGAGMDIYATRGPILLFSSELLIFRSRTLGYIHGILTPVTLRKALC